MKPNLKEARAAGSSELLVTGRIHVEALLNPGVKSPTTGRGQTRGHSNAGQD